MRERINYMFTVPVMYQMMADAAEWDAADFSHVHYFFSGAAPMPVPVIKRYQEEKGVRFAQGYGMTEALQISALSSRRFDHQGRLRGKGELPRDAQGRRRRGQRRERR